MKIRRLFSTFALGLGLTLALVWALSGAAHAASIDVNTFDDVVAGGGNCSLREAILSAGHNSSGLGCTAGGAIDVIHLDTGTYALTLAGTGEDAGLWGDLDITDTLMIAGNGPAQTIIDATGLITDRVLHIHSTTATVVISGVTILGGNVDGNGGGIYNDAANLVLINTVVQGNRATCGGGVYVESGRATFDGGQILGNSTTQMGGGVFASSGSVTLDGGQVLSNTSALGGGVSVFNGVFTQTGDSTIAYNSSSTYGGGVLVIDANGRAALIAGQVHDNQANMGGGQVLSNSAVQHGGGLYVNGGSATVRGGELRDNDSGYYGGGVYVESGSATMSGGEVLSNSAAFYGGGVYLTHAAFTQTGSAVVAYNVAALDGGGLSRWKTRAASCPRPASTKSAFSARFTYRWC